MKEFELFLVNATSWSQGAEGTLGGENIMMAKTIYERDDCVTDLHCCELYYYPLTSIIK